VIPPRFDSLYFSGESDLVEAEENGKLSYINRTTGEVVLSVETVCGVVVARKPSGEIVWLKKTVTQICDEYLRCVNGKSPHRLGGAQRTPTSRQEKPLR
jgi:hypothetical protein